MMCQERDKKAGLVKRLSLGVERPGTSGGPEQQNSDKTVNIDSLIENYKQVTSSAVHAKKEVKKPEETNKKDKERGTTFPLKVEQEESF